MNTSWRCRVSVPKQRHSVTASAIIRLNARPNVLHFPQQRNTGKELQAGGLAWFLSDASKIQAKRCRGSSPFGHCTNFFADAIKQWTANHQLQWLLRTLHQSERVSESRGIFRLNDAAATVRHKAGVARVDGVLADDELVFSDRSLLIRALTSQGAESWTNYSTSIAGQCRYLKAQTHLWCVPPKKGNCS